MKQCPTCRTTYTDETLRFCLADGSMLDASDEEQSTMVRSAATPFSEKTLALGKDAPLRVEIPIIDPSTRMAGQQGMPASGLENSNGATGGSSSGLIVKILLAIIGLGILGLLIVGVAGAVFYFSSAQEARPSVNAAETKPLQASPTPAKEDRDGLRDQIANLQKQLDEQKKATQPANTPLIMPKQSATNTTARANSPGDGFLALRSLPSSEVGDRIVKIPHGATVSIGACGPVIKPVSKSGRWCQATYNGHSGWVFDAFLQY